MRMFVLDIEGVRGGGGEERGVTYPSFVYLHILAVYESLSKRGALSLTSSILEYT